MADFFRSKPLCTLDGTFQCIEALLSEAVALRCVRNKSHTSSGLRLALERTLELISSRRTECTSRIAGASRIVDDTNTGNRTTARIMNCESMLKAPCSRLESDLLLPESSVHHHRCRHHHHCHLIINQKFVSWGAANFVGSIGKPCRELCCALFTHLHSLLCNHVSELFNSYGFASVTQVVESVPVNGSTLWAFACDAGWDEDVVGTGSRSS